MAKDKAVTRGKKAPQKKGRGKQATRGARALPDPNEEVGLRPLRLALTVSFLLLVAAGLGYSARWLWQQAPAVELSRVDALENVRVKAPFRAVTETEVEDILLPHLRQGFFSLDIDEANAKFAVAQAWFDRTDRLGSSVSNELDLKHTFIQ